MSVPILHKKIEVHAPAICKQPDPSWLICFFQVTSAWLIFKGKVRRKQVYLKTRLRRNNKLTCSMREKGGWKSGKSGPAIACMLPIKLSRGGWIKGWASRLLASCYLNYFFAPWVSSSLTACFVRFRRGFGSFWIWFMGMEEEEELGLADSNPSRLDLSAAVAAAVPSAS